MFRMGLTQSHEDTEGMPGAGRAGQAQDQEEGGGEALERVVMRPGGGPGKERAARDRVADRVTPTLVWGSMSASRDRHWTDCLRVTGW